MLVPLQPYVYHILYVYRTSLYFTSHFTWFTKMATHFYRIGTPNVPWGDSERAAWLADVGVIQRSYADEVLAKLETLKDRFDVVQYAH